MSPLREEGPCLSASHAAHGTPAVWALIRPWCCAVDHASVLERGQRFDPALLDDDPLIRIWVDEARAAHIRFSSRP